MLDSLRVIRTHRAPAMKQRGIEEIRSLYQKLRVIIEERLKEFEELIRSASEEALFAELVFCLFTPQSSAHACWDSVCRIVDRKLLCSESNPEKYHPYMKGVRFHKTKSKRLIEARAFFSQNDRLQIRSYLLENAPSQTRDRLVADIKGLGMKEASHFLRNIGLGKELAILDRHILRQLERFGVIKEIPANLSKARYLEIEERMSDFASEIAIPLAALDFVFWHDVKEEIFK